MRAFWTYLLLLLFGCGLLSFFALEHNVTSETAVMPPANQEIVTFVVIVTTTPEPVNDPLLLTATSIVQQATQQVNFLTETASSQTDGSDTRLSDAMLFVATGAAQMATDIANATQYAVDRTTTPMLTATIEGCIAPTVLEGAEPEVMNRLQQGFDEADLSLTVSVIASYITYDCIDYEVQYALIDVGFQAFPQTEEKTYPTGTELAEEIDTAVEIIIADENNLTDASVDFALYVYQSDTGRITHNLRQSVPLFDLKANYEDGLTGLNLFLPRGD